MKKRFIVHDDDSFNENENNSGNSSYLSKIIYKPEPEDTRVKNSINEIKQMKK